MNVLRENANMRKFHLENNKNMRIEPVLYARHVCRISERQPAVLQLRMCERMNIPLLLSDKHNTRNIIFVMYVRTGTRNKAERTTTGLKLNNQTL